jgi:hypothetical protein
MTSFVFRSSYVFIWRYLRCVLLIISFQMSGAVPGSHGGEMYLVQGGPGSVDGEGLGLSHTIRASPATVLLICCLSTFYCGSFM